MSEPVRRIELFTGVGRRRRWSADEKAAIVAESYAGGDTVCGVARRHGLTPQQLFTWRRLSRRDPIADTKTPLFVPALIEGPRERAVPEPQQSCRARRRSFASGIELEIEGVVVRVGPGAKPNAIKAVIRALKAGS